MGIIIISSNSSVLRLWTRKEVGYLGLFLSVFLSIV